MLPLYKLLNWYTQHLLFPKRGWKFVHPLLRFFNLSSKVYKKKLFNGLHMYVNATDHIQKNIFWYGRYEEEASFLWQRIVQNDSVVLDIGANIGYFSLLAAAKAIEGKVISFEPVSAFRNDFKKNIALNNFKNIEVLSFAVSDKNEETDIYLSADDNLGMTSLTPPENFSGKKERISTIVLDEWTKTKNLSKIDIVKIDVEGAEEKVLTGMTDILQNQRPAIFIEIINTQLSRFDSSAEELWRLLQQCGYQGYEITKRCTLKQLTDCKEGYNLVFLPTGYALPQDVTIES